MVALLPRPLMFLVESRESRVGTLHRIAAQLDAAAASKAAAQRDKAASAAERLDFTSTTTQELLLPSSMSLIRSRPSAATARMSTTTMSLGSSTTSSLHGGSSVVRRRRRRRRGGGGRGGSPQQKKRKRKKKDSWRPERIGVMPQGLLQRRLFEALLEIRTLTLQIVEGTIQWRSGQQCTAPLLVDGNNYLLRMVTDLNFLSESASVCAMLEVEPGKLRCNPLLRPHTLPELSRQLVSEEEGLLLLSGPARWESFGMDGAHGAHAMRDQEYDNLDPAGSEARDLCRAERVTRALLQEISLVRGVEAFVRFSDSLSGTGKTQDQGDAGVADDDATLETEIGASEGEDGTAVAGESVLAPSQESEAALVEDDKMAGEDGEEGEEEEEEGSSSSAANLLSSKPLLQVALDAVVGVEVGQEQDEKTKAAGNVEESEKKSGEGGEKRQETTEEEWGETKGAAAENEDGDKVAVEAEAENEVKSKGAAAEENTAVADVEGKHEEEIEKEKTGGADMKEADVDGEGKQAGIETTDENKAADVDVKEEEEEETLGPEVIPPPAWTEANVDDEAAAAADEDEEKKKAPKASLQPGPDIVGRLTAFLYPDDHAAAAESRAVSTETRTTAVDAGHRMLTAASTRFTTTIAAGTTAAATTPTFGPDTGLPRRLMLHYKQQSSNAAAPLREHPWIRKPRKVFLLQLAQLATQAQPPKPVLFAVAAGLIVLKPGRSVPSELEWHRHMKAMLRNGPALIGRMLHLAALTQAQISHAGTAPPGSPGKQPVPIVSHRRLRAIKPFVLSPTFDPVILADEYQAPAAATLCHFVRHLLGNIPGYDGRSVVFKIFGRHFGGDQNDVLVEAAAEAKGELGTDKGTERDPSTPATSKPTIKTALASQSRTRRAPERERQGNNLLLWEERVLGERLRLVSALDLAAAGGAYDPGSILLKAYCPVTSRELRLVLPAGHLEHRRLTTPQQLRGGRAQLRAMCRQLLDALRVVQCGAQESLQLVEPAEQLHADAAARCGGLTTVYSGHS